MSDLPEFEDGDEVRTFNSKEAEYGVAYQMFKPSKSGEGSASKLEYKKYKKPNKFGNGFNYETQVFWMAVKQNGTNQNGDATFAWQDKTKQINLKLGMPDIGKILLVLRRMETEAKILHVPGGAKEYVPGGDSTSLNLRYSPKNDKFPHSFSLDMGSQRNGQTIKVRHGISMDEAVVLESWLQNVLNSYWDKPKA